MYELRSSEFFSGRPSAARNPPEVDVRPVDLQPGVTVSLVSFQSEKERYQSGEVDRDGGISKCGDHMARHLLYEAANVLLASVCAWSSLKAWARNWRASWR